jgi:hypothetical protein
MIWKVRPSPPAEALARASDAAAVPHGSELANGFQPVRCALIRAKEPKALLLEIELHHVEQQRAEHPRGFRLQLPGIRTATA